MSCSTWRRPTENGPRPATGQGRRRVDGRAAGPDPPARPGRRDHARGRTGPGKLAELYRRAAVVLVPSEAEGFGLPVIEALACGAAVVASDIPAHAGGRRPGRGVRPDRRRRGVGGRHGEAANRPGRRAPRNGAANVGGAVLVDGPRRDHRPGVPPAPLELSCVILGGRDAQLSRQPLHHRVALIAGLVQNQKIIGVGSVFVVNSTAPSVLRALLAAGTPVLYFSLPVAAQAFQAIDTQLGAASTTDLDDSPR